MLSLMLLVVPEQRKVLVFNGRVLSSATKGGAA